MSLVLDPTNLLILHFVDRNGKHATSQYWIDSGEVDPLSGGAADLAAKAAALSLSALVAIEIKRTAKESAPATPDTGPYQRPADKAKYVFAGADGSPVIIEIGAPTAGQFGASAITIDPTVTAVSDFVTVMKSSAKTAQGAAITGLTSGYRRRPSRRKGQ